MTWDAPYPRQNLSRFNWVGLLALGCIVVCLASQGWFAAAYAAGGVEGAAMLYCIMRAEIGPIGWPAWHVEWIVERIRTAGAKTTLSFDKVTSSIVTSGLVIAIAKARARRDQRIGHDRERRSASAIGQRLHGLLHTSLLRSRLTSTRAGTTAIPVVA